MFNRGINETQNTPQKVARDDLLNEIYTELCTCRAQLNRIEDQNSRLILQGHPATRSADQVAQPSSQAAEPAATEPSSQASQAAEPAATEPSSQASQAAEPATAEPTTEPTTEPSSQAAADPDVALLEQLSAQPLQATWPVKPKRRVTKKKA